MPTFGDFVVRLHSPSRCPTAQADTQQPRDAEAAESERDDASKSPSVRLVPGKQPPAVIGERAAALAGLVSACLCLSVSLSLSLCGLVSAARR